MKRRKTYEQTCGASRQQPVSISIYATKVKRNRGWPEATKCHGGGPARAAIGSRTLWGRFANRPYDVLRGGAECIGSPISTWAASIQASARVGWA